MRRATPLVALACAVALAACGSGDDGTAESTVSRATIPKSSQQPSSGSGANDSEQGGGSERGGTAKGGGGSSSGGYGGGSNPVGGDSSRGARDGADFKVPGGDNSIQEFGEEAAGSDLSQAQEAVAALFRAFRSSDWSEVCDRYLSEETFETIKEIAKASPVVQGTACPDVLAGLYSTGVTPTEPESSVSAMRISGKLGFVLYRGTDGKGYASPMSSEDGRWKLSALGPTPLEP